MTPMHEIVLEQAIYGSQGSGGYRFLGRSSGFLDEWLPEAERICTGFGDKPANVACPAVVFAKPLGKKHVAVVQVAEQGIDDAGRPGALAFRLLVLGRADYSRLEGDPFHIADQLPPDWRMRELLPSPTWTAGPPPRRTVARLQELLQRPGGPILIPDSEVRQGGSHVLLGGVQALLDGSRVLLIRPEPDPGLIRGLWLLLPTKSRCELWPATFAFDNRLAFDAVVMPPSRSSFAGGGQDGLKTARDLRYLTEEQVADYPEGRYELNLQTATEAGDQEALDALFARRTRRDMLRLVALIFVIVVVLVLVIQWLPVPNLGQGGGPPQPAATAPGGNLNLPPAEKYPKLSDDERRRLTEALTDLAESLGLALPAATTAEQFVLAIDKHLGTPDPQRSPGPLADLGPVARQVQALGWKHGLAEYADPKLSAPELVERLQRKLAERKPGGKGVP